MAALEERAAELSNLTRFDDEADNDRSAGRRSSPIRTGKAAHRCPRGWWSAPTAGNRFAARPPASKSARRDLHQSALTFNISHSRPHHNISTEFHTPQGPCVFVPLPGNRCSVVWVSAPREAERLMALERRRIVRGRRKAIAFHPRPRPRRSRPQPVSAGDRAAPRNSPAIASRWSASPPMWCRRSARRVSTWDCATPPTSPTSRARRSRSAKTPARRRCWRAISPPAAPTSRAGLIAIDIANRSLLSDFLPMQSLRAAGMHLIGSFGPLRRLAMREGLAPTWRRVS